MSSEPYSNFRLANLGVVGGLVFVGMQLQQNREIAVVAHSIEAEATIS